MRKYKFDKISIKVMTINGKRNSCNKQIIDVNFCLPLNAGVNLIRRLKIPKSNRDFSADTPYFSHFRQVYSGF